LTERFEDETWTNYIIQYRQQGATAASTAGNGDFIGRVLQSALGTSGGNAASGTTATKINSFFDLVGNEGSPFADDLDEMNEYMPLLYDNLSVSDKPVVGRININQASRTVLELLTAQEDTLTDTATLLGESTDAANALLGSETPFSQLDIQEIIENILTQRVSDPYLIDSPEMNYPFWIYTHGIVTDIEVMKKLEGYFCCQGAVYKANIVGRFDEKSPTARLEIWLDASQSGNIQADTEQNDTSTGSSQSSGYTFVPARVIRFRDITQLGPGYSSELLGTGEEKR
jgi:hypothetical protein